MEADGAIVEGVTDRNKNRYRYRKGTGNGRPFPDRLLPMPVHKVEDLNYILMHKKHSG